MEVVVVVCCGSSRIGRHLHRPGSRSHRYHGVRVPVVVVSHRAIHTSRSSHPGQDSAGLVQVFYCPAGPVVVGVAVDYSVVEDYSELAVAAGTVATEVVEEGVEVVDRRCLGTQDLAVDRHSAHLEQRYQPS